eukprot:CAMPEP_0167771518 /NCGR_PEP_ID=MMETSP0111_2-20121227/326_1 /TAXON_ID=91324 /ORGANISM="Lotharella globosa, Strain CCCM811" /LENGTH=136 /DNA_ID=CAMNT_0007660887 /DNA_START=29 /DNA_END=439 /DNA_ORIENTATION=+
MRIQTLGTSFFLAGPKRREDQEGEREIERERKTQNENIHKYSEYQVVKTNAQGRRQERVLGIDPWNLHNKKPKGSGGVWRKQRSLKEVSEVHRLQNPGTFAIRFTNGTSREYECVDKSQVDEIIKKITVLRSNLFG